MKVVENMQLNARLVAMARKMECRNSRVLQPNILVVSGKNAAQNNRNTPRVTVHSAKLPIHARSTRIAIAVASEGALRKIVEAPNPDPELISLAQ
jgi:hypothetical protein